MSQPNKRGLSTSQRSKTMVQVQKSFRYRQGTLTQKYSDQFTVYVGNLPSNVAPEDLRPIFARSGTIADITIRCCKGYAVTIDGKDAQCSLYATIQFTARNEMKAALIVNVQLGMGKLVIVDNPMLLPYTKQKMQEFYDKIKTVQESGGRPRSALFAASAASGRPPGTAAMDGSLQRQITEIVHIRKRLLGAPLPVVIARNLFETFSSTLTSLLRQHGL